LNPKFAHIAAAWANFEFKQQQKTVILVWFTVGSSPSGLVGEDQEHFRITHTRGNTESSG
jgi:hypothetical protein